MAITVSSLREYENKSLQTTAIGALIGIWPCQSSRCEHNSLPQFILPLDDAPLPDRQALERRSQYPGRVPIRRKVHRSPIAVAVAC